ncbi:MAG: hypothetical protein ACOZF0_16315 [Thermodesulfobacteriota bacterium]
MMALDSSYKTVRAESSSGIAIFFKDVIRLLNVEIRVDRFLASRRFFSIRHVVILYLRRFTSIAVEAAILVTAVWLVSTLLLYAAYILWKLYIQTLMGRQYLEFFPQRAEIINEILDYESWYLAGDATLAAFVICLGLGALGSFFHINRHFYLSRGVMGKALLWGPVLTAVVAYHLYMEYGFSSWEGIAIVAAVPTYCLFPTCYDYSGRLLPELGDLVHSAGPYFKKIKAYIARTME